MASATRWAQKKSVDLGNVDVGRRRFLVTGIGAVTSLGLDARTTFAGLLEGRSGVGPITHFDPKDHATKFAAQVRGFDPATVLPAHEARKLDPFVLFAMAAVKEALADSGLGAPGLLESQFSKNSKLAVIAPQKFEQHRFAAI